MKKTKKTKKAAKKTARKAPASKSGIGFAPLGDRVVIKPTPQETTTSFGIIIPESAKEKPEQGTVVAVGPGKRTDSGQRVPMDVKVGDKVFFKKPWDEPMKVNGTEYYIIAESEITLIKQ